MIDGVIMAMVGLWVTLVAYGKISDPTPTKRFQTHFFRMGGPTMLIIGVLLAVADAVR